MAQKQKQRNYVTIKGTRDGLILRLDDTCSFDELLKELEEKLRTSHRHQGDTKAATVNLQVGNRFITDEQEQKLRNLILQKKHLLVNEIVSNVMTKEEAEQIRKESEIHSVTGMVRSGQVLEVEGDLLLIGDVNPGGCVKATGNIFVMGNLKGVAHAGSEGNLEAVISASDLRPAQVWIGSLFAKELEEVSYMDTTHQQCAYVDLNNNKIMFDRVQVLQQLRPNLTRL